VCLSINGFTLGGSAEGTRNFAAALGSTVFFRPGHTCHSALAAKLRTASNADAPQCFARPPRNIVVVIEPAFLVGENQPTNCTCHEYEMFMK